jgi:hypothetical protein
MQKREPLLTEDHFDKAIRRSQKFVVQCEANGLLSADEVRLDLIYLSLFQRYHQIIELKYSRGHSIEELKSDFLA